MFAGRWRDPVPAEGALAGDRRQRESGAGRPTRIPRGISPVYGRLLYFS